MSITMEIFLLSPQNDRHDKIIYIFPLLRGWFFEPCYKLKARLMLKTVEFHLHTKDR